ncbi:MAG: YbhB/YbcL family Raf kinase inhibitor-like protein [Elusimicrobiota bacterium]
MDKKLFITIFSLVLFLSGCSNGSKSSTEELGESQGGHMELKSPAFGNGEKIPPKYTADGKDISPPLTISEVHEKTESLTLVVDDPDAPMGTWDHWIIWNIPPEVTRIEEGTAPEGIKGKNDFGKLEYGGPAPPSGTHTYVFKLYALDKELELTEGSTKKELAQAMEGHIIEESILKGNYSRQG